MLQIKMWAVFNVHTHQVCALFQRFSEAEAFKAEQHKHYTACLAIVRRDLATLKAGKDCVFLAPLD